MRDTTAQAGPAATITISHTREDGTTLGGSSKGDGAWEILRGLHHNWRFSRHVGIFVGQSRDKAANTYRIRAAAEALRAAGFEVAVEVDDTETRSFEQIETARYERAEDRADRMTTHAANAAARSEAAFSAAHQAVEGIPMGQPILVGHHSERRHRRALERSDNGMRRGFEEAGKAEHYDRRAESAATEQARRESVPTTLRRIKTLEAESRRCQRSLAGTGSTGRAATGQWAERLTARVAEIAEEVAYWRNHVAAKAEAGVKVWSKTDFAKGEFVRFLGGWYEVQRVNAKSLTIPAMINDGPVVRMAGARCTWTDTIPYDKVTGRKTAAEITAAEAKGSGDTAVERSTK